jgi:hypothetical protein
MIASPPVFPKSTSASRRQVCVGASLFALALVTGSAAPAQRRRRRSRPLMRAEDLKLAMRKLWEDHITYTRNFIISALATLPDQQAVTQRLLRNQDDIGDAIKPVYGNAAGTELTRLLRDHILIAADVVMAAKAGDSARLATQQRRWSNNGGELAAFLAGANPYLQRAQLASMLQRHLDLTTGEVVGRLSGNWAADIRSYDAGHEHMLMFSDALTDAIVRQFPNRFY